MTDREIAEEKEAAYNLWKTCCDTDLVEHFSRTRSDSDWEE